MMELSGMETLMETLDMERPGAVVDEHVDLAVLVVFALSWGSAGKIIWYVLPHLATHMIKVHIEIRNAGEHIVD